MGISGDGDRKLAELAARLAGADPLLRNQLRRKWTAALHPAVDAVKESILTSPAKYERGLRQEVARTVHPEVRLAREVQVSIVSRGGEMPPGKTELPHHLDTGGWRHPVFADDENWVSQASNRPGWFTLTCLGQQPRFAEAAQAALDQAGRDLEG